MKTVRDACQLQPNALSVKLSDQIEQLDELITAEGDGSAYFEKTHITLGMRDLIAEGIARLAGASSQAVCRARPARRGRHARPPACPPLERKSRRWRSEAACGYRFR